MSEETEITPFNPVRTLVDPEEAARMWAEFEQLKAKLLTKDDYQKVSGKEYVKKSGFRKIAVVFGISDELLEEEKIVREDETFMWRIVVKATAPNGRSATGVGICDLNERRHTAEMKNRPLKAPHLYWSHVEHDVYATAHTRAKNRAISDLVAGGIVSSEEMASVYVPPKNVKSEIVKPSEPQVQVRLGPLTLSVIEDNFRALTYAHEIREYDHYELFADTASIYIAPREALEAELQEKITELLEEYNPTWQDQGQFGQWKIPKEQG